MKQQKGAALIVVLSLLTISLMVGLSSMQSSQVDERLAGNYRASALAYSAAEHGASLAWTEIEAVKVSDASYGTFKSALDSRGVLGVGVIGNGTPQVSYEVKVMSEAGLNVPVRSVGTVSDGEGVISVREIEILASLDGIAAGRLSPINLPATLENYRGLSSQAELEGEEEVIGFRNPAISAASKEEAQRIVDDIGGNAVFVGEGEDGVFYAAETVDEDGVYTGDYSNCNSGPNRMCNYKGGIATKPQEKILSDADQFDEFISALFFDAYESPSTLSGSMSGFNIVSSGKFMQSGEYFPEYYDGEECIDERCQPERDDFTGSGNAAGDGVLIIDGNVEFNGNPEFEGLIIVLGDYKVTGGGGGDLKGALIAAPYSCKVEGSERSCEFDNLDVDIRGGGGNDYLHVLEYLDKAWEMLAEKSPEAARIWLEKNNPDGDFTYSAIGWDEVL